MNWMINKEKSEMKTIFMTALALTIGISGCASNDTGEHKTPRSHIVKKKKAVIKPHGYLIASLSYVNGYQMYSVFYKNMDTGRGGAMRVGTDPILVIPSDNRPSYQANGSVICKALPAGNYKITGFGGTNGILQPIEKNESSGLSKIFGLKGFMQVHKPIEPDIYFTISNAGVTYIGNFNFTPTAKLLNYVSQVSISQQSQLASDWNHLKIKLSNLSEYKIKQLKQTDCNPSELSQIEKSINEQLNKR